MTQIATDQQGLAACCVDQIRQLASELEGASNILANLSITEFEQRLWKQEMLCATLRRTLSTLSQDAISSESRRQLKEEAGRLHRSVKRYQHLTNQCGATNDLLRQLAALRSNAPSSRTAVSTSVSVEV